MTWERFRCNTDCYEFPADCISENLIISMANQMLKDNWLEVGYDTIVIDDCWSTMERDPQTQRLLPDPERFPNGMKNLSTYVHSLGFKFGIYGDYGTKTCGGYPGSMNFEKIDADTFAEWEVDYIKMDGCYATNEQKRVGYEKFGHYLNQTGRHIFYSCSYPAYLNGDPKVVDYDWLGKVCHSWRNFVDVDDNFNSIAYVGNWFGDNMAELRKFTGLGKFHDADMLLGGNYGVSELQSKLQVSLWSMMMVPLFLSTDLRNIDDNHKKILQNKKALAIVKDPLLIPAYRIYSNNGLQVWAKPLMNQRFAILISNFRSDETIPFAFTLEILVQQVLQDHIDFRYNKFYVIDDVWEEFNAKMGNQAKYSVVSLNERINIYLRTYDTILWLFRPVRSEYDLKGISHNRRAMIRSEMEFF